MSYAHSFNINCINVNITLTQFCQNSIVKTLSLYIAEHIKYSKHKLEYKRFVLVPQAYPLELVYHI